MVAKLNTNTRRYAPALAVLTTLALLAGLVSAADAGKGKRKPQIDDPAIAVYNASTSTVGISVRVERAKKVVVTFAGQRQKAVHIHTLPDWYDVFFTGAPDQRCYRIEVKGKKKKRRAERELRACEGKPGY